MDRVIEAALLPASASSLKQSQFAEESRPEPRPLHHDERVLSSHKRKIAVPLAPVDVQQDDERMNEPEPFLIPPADHNVTGDSFPHVQAKHSEE
ncbi:MAG: hypothetical protein NVS3B14_09940 [Ktedonobacteraceae bacterium]